jgi:Asp-tRNA(Asn)/Glu-tRNA(Gln) amidotransferase A subunit family amidase
LGVVDALLARGAQVTVVARDPVRLAEVFGLPAVQRPVWLRSERPAGGLQIVGRPWDDGVVLGLARQYEPATAWKAKHAIE